MNDKLYVNENFHCYSTSFEEFLAKLREVCEPLEKFTISLGFRGAGWDDDIWCDWKGINIWGWRYKTADELAAESEAKQAAEARKIAATESIRINRIRNHADQLRQKQIELTAQLTEAQAELVSFEQENPND